MTFLPELILVVVWSLATYRVTRFVILDSLIDQFRIDVHDWLLGMAPEIDRKQSRRMRFFWRVRPNGANRFLSQISYLLGCPYCLSIWVAAGILFTHRLFVDDFAMPVWLWLATAAASLVWYQRVDPKP